MKTTTVWCLVIAISVLAVTESSKRNSTGRYKQSLCLLIDYMREFMASVRCARSVVGVVSAFVSRVLHLIQSFVQFCFCEEKYTSELVFWSHKLTFCSLIVERFLFKEVCFGRGYALPLKCVTVVKVDYVLRFNGKNNCRSSCRNLYPLPGRCKIHLV